ncbi:MAG TPA: hypothetical protein VHR66_16060 [Gemmataceae bacterium]|jgi:hypothetical protein|nr:hypothetical protein [Gemmataceae bacterium]
MKTRLVLAIVFLWSAGWAAADTPPTWDEFNVTSANKKFVAKVTVKDKMGKTERYNWSFALSVYKTGDEATPIWTCPFGHSGEPGGFLSDDGKHFAIVGFWYYDEPATTHIYREGKLIKSFAGKEFSLDKTKLRKTASHQLWWSDSEQPKFDGDKALVIPTIDGQVFRIDLQSLDLKPQRGK